MRKFWAPLVPLIFFAALSELAVAMGWIQSYILPAPSQVFHSLISDREELLQAAFFTFSASLLGLLASFAVGALLSISLSLSRFLREAFYPYAVFFQTVPVVAIAPLLVIWFGYGLPTVVTSAFVVSIFPVIASTLLGLQSTDPALTDLFSLYQASKFHLLWKLKIPNSLPFVFSGLRIGAGLSVIGAIVGEFIGGGGLGGVVDEARTQQRIDKVFAAILISSVLGLLLVSAVNLASHFFLRRWHSSEHVKSS